MNTGEEGIRSPVDEHRAGSLGYSEDIHTRAIRLRLDRQMLAALQVSFAIVKPTLLPVG